MSKEVVVSNTQPKRTQTPAADQHKSESGKRGTVAIDQRIYKAVFNAVMSHSLPPGTRLGEAELCELYNVSRTTVRKALQNLAHDYIVELRPNRGAVVASPTPEEARQIFAARRAVEREIVPLVVSEASTASLQKLKQAVHAEHAALESGDRPSWIRLGGEFHLLLAQVAGNQVLLRFLTELVSRCSLIIALYESPGSPICEDHDHEQLISLIEAGDVNAATQLMEQHLHEIEARLRLGQPKVSLAVALAGY